MYEDRVEKGAALMDQVRPGWAREIVVADLEMGSKTNDVLGQIYGNYEDGCRRVARDGVPIGTMRNSSNYGFTLTHQEQEDEAEEVIDRFDALTEAWRAEIRRRLA